MNATPTVRRLGQPSTPDHTLDPSKIAFGRSCTPNFFTATYRDGFWRNPQIEPLHDLSLHPAALVFHYAQAIFEGLKAYRWIDDSIHLFRPEENARRFNSSARRMNMPEVPEELFLEAVESLVDTDRKFVPSRPGTLYIRPTMIATEPCVGVRASKEYLFYIITLPAGAYFPNNPVGAASIRVQVAEHVARAARGGTGGVKAATNYAVTLKALEDAKRQMCDQVLFLDAAGDRMVEELGGMNIFFVQDGNLVTPRLRGTILPGITRDSIILFASRLQIGCREELISIDDVVAGIRNRRISEVFACGTAAVVTSITSLRLESGTIIDISDGPGPMAKRLYEILEGIQFGVAPDPLGWTSTVNAQASLLY